MVGSADNLQSGPTFRIESSTPECDMPLNSPSRPSSDRRSWDARHTGGATGAAANEID